MKIKVRMFSVVATKCWVGSSDWLDELIHGETCFDPIDIPPLGPRVKVIGTSISFHVPGFHRHFANAAKAELSSAANPVDLIRATLVTEPVLRSSETRNNPEPLWCCARSLNGYSGVTV